MEKKKTSIYTIATSLGVTPATVSYVINGKYHKMSLKTRERILEEIKRTGYVPDVNARGLSLGRTRLIGLFLPISEDEQASRMLENPFYSEVIGSIEKYNRDSEYDLILGYKDQDSFIPWALSRNFDAIVMLGKFPTDEAFKVDNLHIPLIFIDVYADEFSKYSNIRTNDRHGMYLATKHLLDLGHKNIGYVGVASRSDLDKARYLGYVDALNEAEIPVNNSLSYVCYPDFDRGQEIANEIMKNEKVTAVVCSADIIAIGIIHQYEKLNKKIPDDLSIVGFDDIKQASYIFPSLTTIHQNIDEKIRVAIEMIKQEIEHNTESHQTVVIEPTLVVRNSTKKI